jgi:hypothetical protein
MEIKLYIIILVYFLVGGVAMTFINKGKPPEFRKKNWIKYFTYLVIINILFMVV